MLEVDIDIGLRTIVVSFSSEPFVFMPSVEELDIKMPTVTNLIEDIPLCLY